jgi:putative tryptophan/tyrosine transport system substrate-binding protein
MTNRGALTAAVKDAATQLGLQLTILEARAAGDFEAAFASLVRLGAGALLVGNDAFFISRREQLVALAARHAVAAIYEVRSFVDAGGLISYGTSLSATSAVSRGVE